MSNSELKIDQALKKTDDSFLQNIRRFINIVLDKYPKLLSNSLVILHEFEKPIPRLDIHNYQTLKYKQNDLSKFVEVSDFEKRLAKQKQINNGIIDDKVSKKLVNTKRSSMGRKYQQKTKPIKKPTTRGRRSVLSDISISPEIRAMTKFKPHSQQKNKPSIKIKETIQK